MLGILGILGTLWRSLRLLRNALVFLFLSLLLIQNLQSEIPYHQKRIQTRFQ